MAQVIDRRTNTTTTVKNLGWLRRHFSKVVDLEVKHDGTLTANLLDDRQYIITFASLWVCWRWLHRPSLLGYRVNWLGTTKIITMQNYTDIYR